MTGNWAGSTRNATLPPDWPARRRDTFDRDGHQCTWLHGYRDGGPADYLAGRYNPARRCTNPAQECDHIGDPGDHGPDNRRSLCRHHHGRRSSAQGNAARWRHREKRPAEPHPGLR